MALVTNLISVNLLSVIEIASEAILNSEETYGSNPAVTTVRTFEMLTDLSVNLSTLRFPSKLLKRKDVSPTVVACASCTFYMTVFAIIISLVNTLALLNLSRY